MVVATVIRGGGWLSPTVIRAVDGTGGGGGSSRVRALQYLDGGRNGRLERMMLAAREREGVSAVSR
jgi:hypothetical protein